MISAGRPRAGRGWGCAVAAGVAAALLSWSGAAAQGLDEYDYENLTPRGFGIFAGMAFPNIIENTATFGGRVDLGYLGPGFRVMPSVVWWSSSLRRSEIQKLEEQLEALVATQAEPGAPPLDLNLGSIRRRDLAIGLDGHIVWAVRLGFMTYLGAGGALHILDGRGQAIAGTFVEDLLDSVSAGVNLHGGIEVPIADRVRAFGEARYEWLGDLGYPELRFGAQLLWTDPAPGEVGGR